MEESRNCRHCGAAFIARRKNQYYCTRTCKDRGISAAYRARNVHRPCSVDGCTKPALDKTHCSMHYRRLRLTGDVGPAGKVRGDRFGVTPCSIEGCTRTYYAKGMCSLHYNRARLKGEPGGAALLKRPDGAGTVAIVGGYRRLQWYKNGKRIAVAEHRQVMEQVLGRPLEPFENVHHKNGRRADNRPENLEVWIVPQPCGQRAEDLVDWVLDHFIELVQAKLSERNL